VQYVSQPIASIYNKCLNEGFGIYKCGGSEITEVHCDIKFHKVMDNYSIKQDSPIQRNYVAAKACVPRAQQNNCTIQERFHTTYHRLPYKFTMYFGQLSGNRDSAKINVSPK